jgi:hypothetical protein
MFFEGRPKLGWPDPSPSPTLASAAPVTYLRHCGAEPAIPGPVPGNALRSALTFLLLFASLACARGEDICIKQLSMIMPYSGKLQFRECRYYLSEDVVAKLPAFDPKAEEGRLTALKALSVAFEGYFSKHGVARDDFYQMATVTLEKVDDYTASEMAKDMRMRPAKVRNIWFYVVTFGSLDYGETRPRLSPLLILMDGTLVFARERQKQAAHVGRAPTIPLAPALPELSG